MVFHDIMYFRDYTSSFLIEIKVQLRWRWVLKEQLVKFSSASRKLDSCWLFEKGQGMSIALRNGVSVLMNSMTLNNGAGSVIFPDNIQSEWTPLCVDVKEISMPVTELTLVLLKALYLFLMQTSCVLGGRGNTLYLIYNSSAQIDENGTLKFWNIVALD